MLAHGYLILFFAVMAEQVGLPFPSSPLLMAAGALAGMHRLNPAAVLSLAILASLLSDSLWYALGRTRGSRILGHVCRVSLEPDTCVSEIHSVYARYGAKSLLFCKFVPGLGTLGPPMAGLMDLAWWRFALLDAAGSFIWSGVFVAAGWVFRTQLELLASSVASFGTVLGIILAVIVASYILIKYLQRRRLYRKLRIARITPIELRERMMAREALIIVDLRNPLEWRDGRIPGSLQFEQGKLDSLMPRLTQSEVILYCSCPNEAASAREALRLKRQGFKHVRPLEGGFERWQDLGFPVEAPEAKAV